jgi:hypothetical protein
MRAVGPPWALRAARGAISSDRTRHTASTCLSASASRSSAKPGTSDLLGQALPLPTHSSAATGEAQEHRYRSDAFARGRCGDGIAAMRPVPAVALSRSPTRYRGPARLRAHRCWFAWRVQHRERWAVRAILAAYMAAGTMSLLPMSHVANAPGGERNGASGRLPPVLDRMRRRSPFQPAVSSELAPGRVRAPRACRSASGGRARAPMRASGASRCWVEAAVPLRQGPITRHVLDAVASTLPCASRMSPSAKAARRPGLVTQPWAVSGPVSWCTGRK